MKYIFEKTELRSSYNIRNISPAGEMLFFDIETTGLKKETTQIYLIGCGSFADDGCFEIRQWLGESALDEKNVLEAFWEFASGFKTLVHFNGDGFDIPYVTYKTEYYGMDYSFDVFRSVDIYKKVKPCKKFLGLQRMGQKAMEEFLGIERNDVMNGGLLIPYFYEYERTGSPEAEGLLLLHNRDDIAGMLPLLAALSYSDIFEGRFRFDIMQVCMNILVMEFKLENPVKTPVTYERPGLIICAEKDLLQINIEIFEGEAKIPVRNIEDYYYLPLEDRIIHKDVAEFVDRKYRKKATAKNAFLKKEGRFIPAFTVRCCEETGTISKNLMMEDPAKKAKGKICLCECVELSEVMDYKALQAETFALNILKSI